LHDALAGAALLTLYGVNTSSGMVAYQSLVQRRVPEENRGGGFALLDVTWQSARLLSIAAGGAIAAAIGIRPLFLAGGCLLVLAGGVGLFGLQRRLSTAVV
jgi:MFS family permease